MHGTVHVHISARGTTQYKMDIESTHTVHCTYTIVCQLSIHRFVTLASCPAVQELATCLVAMQQMSL